MKTATRQCPSLRVQQGKLVNKHFSKGHMRKPKPYLPIRSRTDQKGHYILTVLDLLHRFKVRLMHIYRIKGGVPQTGKNRSNKTKNNLC